MPAPSTNEQSEEEGGEERLQRKRSIKNIN